MRHKISIKNAEYHLFFVIKPHVCGALFLVINRCLKAIIFYINVLYFFSTTEKVVYNSSHK